MYRKGRVLGEEFLDKQDWQEKEKVEKAKQDALDKKRKAEEKVEKKKQAELEKQQKAEQKVQRKAFCEEIIQFIKASRQLYDISYLTADIFSEERQPASPFVPKALRLSPIKKSRSQQATLEVALETRSKYRIRQKKIVQRKKALSKALVVAPLELSPIKTRGGRAAQQVRFTY